jgi:hypothetical protein
MVLSGTHDSSVSDEDFVKFADHWTKFINMDLDVWKEFNDFWMKAKIPVHIVRYEDLLTQPTYTLTEIMKFMFNKEDLSATLIEKLIEIGTQTKAPEVYSPRKGQIGKNNDKYTA